VVKISIRAPRLVVFLEPKPRWTEDGILVLPAGEFVQRLWSAALV
jgi:hypothetical protein